MKQYLEKRGIYITWSQLVMRIIFDLVGFLLALLPAGLTLYLTDVWITSGTHMPTSWILGIIVCVFLIHFYQFYFVNYNSQMNADRMAGNYRQHLAQKILSSSIPAYESQNKARIQNMANDVSAIYTVSSYLVTVPANLVKVELHFTWEWLIRFVSAERTLQRTPYCSVIMKRNVKTNRQRLLKQRQCTNWSL